MKKFVVILLISMGVASVAKAQTTTIPLVRKEINFRGIFSKSISWFRVPELWNPKGTAKVTVTFRFSAILDMSMSSLTLYINKKPAQSVRLLNFTGRAGQWVVAELQFPASILRQGWNKLEFRSYLRTRTHDCDDKDNPGLWMSVSTKSFIHVLWSAVRLQPELADFPKSYVERMDPDEKVINTIMYVPTYAPTEVLSLQGVIATLLGQHGDLLPSSLEARMVGNQVEALPDAHIILAGLKKQVDPILRNWGISGEFYKSLKESKVGQNHATVMELRHPKYAWRRILIITSESAQGINEAKRFFSMAELRIALRGTHFIIADPPKVDIPPAPPRNRLTFADLKIGNLIARGYSGLQQIHFFIPYPAHWVLGDKTKLVLFIRHSQILAPESMLEIDMGDHPIASVPYVIKLPEDKKNKYSLNRIAVTKALRIEIPIPSYLADNTGRLYFTFRFMIEVETRDCALSTVENAWVSVEDRSFIEFDKIGVNRDVLSSYPDILMDKPHMARMALVLSQRTTTQFTLLMRTLVRLGGFIRSDPYVTPTVMDEIDWMAKKDRGYDVMVVGDWKNSKLFKSLARRMPVRFDNKGNLISEYKKFGHAPSFYRKIGLIGILPNPDDKKSSMIFAMGYTPEALKRTDYLLSGQVDTSQLRGNFLVIKTPKIYYLERLYPQQRRMELANKHHSPTKARKKGVASAKKTIIKAKQGCKSSHVMLLIFGILLLIIMGFIIHYFVKGAGANSGKLED